MKCPNCGKEHPTATKGGLLQIYCNKSKSWLVVGTPEYGHYDPQVDLKDELQAALDSLAEQLNYDS